MPSHELEYYEDDEHNERDEERGPVEEEGPEDEDQAAFYREANREYARRGALPKYDPSQPLHF